MQPTSNRHYRIYTRTLGVHEVVAQTKREAIARVVARLWLAEERCATVNTCPVCANEARARVIAKDLLQDAIRSAARQDHEEAADA